MKLVDSHCHLNMLDLTPDAGDIQAVIRRAQDHGVCHFLNVAVNLADFPVLLQTAEAFSFISASVGIHPNEREEEADIDQLVKLGSHAKVVAIGETGLDYFRSEGELDWQRDRFRQHISAAKKLKKPLIVHTRDARQDTLTILREESANEVGGVLHCFTEDWAMAKTALDLGFYISFSGIVTFKNALDLQEVARRVPVDRILIETDAPYLAPAPHRGKPNEPAYVWHTAAFLAALKQIDQDEFALQTTHNFFHLFKGAQQTHV